MFPTALTLALILIFASFENLTYLCWFWLSFEVFKVADSFIFLAFFKLLYFESSRVTLMFSEVGERICPCESTIGLEITRGEVSKVSIKTLLLSIRYRFADNSAGSELSI